MWSLTLCSPIEIVQDRKMIPDHLCFKCIYARHQKEPFDTMKVEDACPYCLNAQTEDRKNGLFIVSKCDNYENYPGKDLYLDYMKSESWRGIARDAIKRADYRCERCGSAKNLNVHHTTYEHLGFEYIYTEDLVVLCQSCHKEIHAVDLKKKSTP